jgi:uncharacterized membrane-anchored protein
MKSSMSFLRICIAAVLFLCPMLSRAQDGGGGATNSPLAKFNWLHGPTNADLKGIATIKVPEGCIFTGASDTRKLLEMFGNRSSAADVGILAPNSLLNPRPSGWFVVFEYEDTGYVKDDDKDKLDADKLLKAIREGNDAANEYRKEKNIPPMTIVGWEQPPKYNPETHNLEWAIRGESEGEPVINYATRLLGRKGVMSVELVVEPSKLAATMPAYQALLTGYTYKQGETYAEYKPGDKLAKYGLAGLITAGAVVVAAKTGLLAIILAFGKKLWVLLVAAVAGVINFFKRLFGGGKKNSDSNNVPPA